MGDIDPIGMLVQTVIYLALVAAVLYVVLRWGLPRLFGKRIVGKGSLELVERLPLGGNRSVCIVKVEGRKYLVGVTDHQVRTLDVLDQGTEQEDLRG
jgi:flagellar biosynthetic protein FliO